MRRKPRRSEPRGAFFQSPTRRQGGHHDDITKNPYPRRQGFSLRVANAKRALRRLGRDCLADIYTRGFDNCFEMFDGDAVVWALMREAVTATIF